MKSVYELEMMVRDYECDLQGIVNNAVYQHYLEHARHEFLHAIGLNFARLCEEGIDAVVTRLQIDYKSPLRPREHFLMRLSMRRQGRLRFVFDQEIIRISDGMLIVQAEVTGVLTRAGRPIPPVIFDEALEHKGWNMTQA